MDADTKEVLTAIAAMCSTHCSSIYVAVSNVSFDFEDGDDFDDDHGAKDNMSISKASGHRGAHVTGDGDDDYYGYEQQDEILDKTVLLGAVIVMKFSMVALVKHLHCYSYQ